MISKKLDFRGVLLRESPVDESAWKPVLILLYDIFKKSIDIGSI